MGANNRGKSPNSMSPIFTKFAASFILQNYDILNTPVENPSRSSFYTVWGLVFVLIFIFLFQLIFYFLAVFSMAGFYNMGFSEVANLISEPDGTAKAINIARAVNFISFGGYMFLPAALFAVINRTGIVHEGGLNVKPKFNVVFICLAILALCIPFVDFLTAWVQSIQWPQYVHFLAEKYEHARTEHIDTILDMHAPVELAVCLVLVALLPALFEELLFRGVLMNIFKHITGKKWTPVFLQALVFAVLHFTVYELPAIFLMGILFGIVAMRTGTIWYGVIMHFVFNSTTVVVAYLNHMAFEKTGIFGEYGNLKLSPFLALLTVFGLFTLLRMFYKLTSKPSNPVKS
jgi:membrane protease YdiL (CAAX protease family)